MASVAFPPLNVALPSDVVPSLKTTDPVGVPVVKDLTVAVKVTEAPCFDGFSEEVTELDVPALLIVCVSTAEVPPVKFESPA